jgi:mannose-6-phosphate isomerase-like protein (cupin superfamily)
MSKEFKKFSLKTFASRGYSLTPIEFKDLIPFEVKRTYYLANFEPGSVTGEHCHYMEEEVFIQLAGRSTAVIDRGNGKEEIGLEAGEAIYAPNYVWHGFHSPSPDCVILALSSTNFNPTREDYLEDYAEYLEIRDEHLGV